jgi:hypothetical protein
LLSLAAVCKALADITDHSFELSIFSSLKRSFWDKAESAKVNGFIKIWKFKTRYRWDAWHLFNTLMIGLFILAGVLHTRSLSWWTLLELMIALTLYNLVFNRFYNKVFRK